MAASIIGIAQGLTDPTNEPGPLQSTSVPMDCIGANLIVISIAYQGSAPIYLSDSEGNSWTLITGTSGGSTIYQNALYYCANPAVSSSQTFHVDCDTGYPLICVMAFSGAASSPLDQSSNNKVDVGGGIQPGSITPSENNCLVVTAMMTTDRTPSVDSGFAADSVGLAPGVTYGGGIAYLVQVTAAAVNPTWTPVVVSGYAAATIASFKPESGGGPTFNPAWTPNRTRIFGSGLGV